MVGDSSLREVIRSYSFRAVARADLIFSIFRVFVAILRVIKIVKPALHNFHCFFPVFELGSFVLTSYYYAGRQMSHSDARFRFIHVLPARTARTISVDFQIFFVYIDFDVNRLGQNGDRHRGRLNPPLRFRFRNSLHAMNAALEFKFTVRALSAYRKDNLFYAAEFGFVYIDFFRFPPVSVGITRIHTV